eukprot:m.117609 g.117609  ORF g.117609 m.117609 type:complete len:129 (+) comp37617_c0_seq7:4110-4496(+)
MQPKVRTVRKALRRLRRKLEKQSDARMSIDMDESLTDDSFLETDDIGTVDQPNLESDHPLSIGVQTEEEPPQDNADIPMPRRAVAQLSEFMHSASVDQLYSLPTKDIVAMLQDLNYTAKVLTDLLLDK